MKELFMRLLMETSGIESLEWAIVGGIIVVAAAIASFSFAGPLRGIFGNMEEQVETADIPPGGG